MISTVDRLGLTALLGRFGSSHVGERDDAARLLEQFRRQRGLNWAGLLCRRPMDDSAGPRADNWPHDPTDGLTDVRLMARPRRPGTPFGAGRCSWDSSCWA
jgi:hypothetical protein